MVSKIEFDGENWTRKQTTTVAMSLLESIAAFFVITKLIIPLIHVDLLTGLSVSFLFALNIRGRYYREAMTILTKRLIYLQLQRQLQKLESEINE